MTEYTASCGCRVANGLVILRCSEAMKIVDILIAEIQSWSPEHWGVNFRPYDAHVSAAIAEALRAVPPAAVTEAEVERESMRVWQRNPSWHRGHEPYHQSTDEARAWWANGWRRCYRYLAPHLTASGGLAAVGEDEIRTAATKAEPPFINADGVAYWRHGFEYGVRWREQAAGSSGAGGAGGEETRTPEAGNANTRSGVGAVSTHHTTTVEEERDGVPGDDLGTGHQRGRDDRRRGAHRAGDAMGTQEMGLTDTAERDALAERVRVLSNLLAECRDAGWRLRVAAPHTSTQKEAEAAWDELYIRLCAALEADGG